MGYLFCDAGKKKLSDSSLNDSHLEKLGLLNHLSAKDKVSSICLKFTGSLETTILVDS